MTYQWIPNFLTCHGRSSDSALTLFLKPLMLVPLHIFSSNCYFLTLNFLPLHLTYWEYSLPSLPPLPVEILSSFQAFPWSSLSSSLQKTSSSSLNFQSTFVPVVICVSFLRIPFSSLAGKLFKRDHTPYSSCCLLRYLEHCVPRST